MNATQVPGTGPVVRIAGVDKTFSRGDQVLTKALEGIDLEVARGEFISLIGPSGCGKSTLLRIVGDLTSPTSGTVVVNGKTAERARRDRDYGMVFQAPVLFDWRTVEDNVKLPLEILGQDSATRTQRAREMLELVELGDFLKHHPYQLSGGMQQRVAIARALVFEPTILLMDEPFASVDAQTRAELEDLTRRVRNDTHKTVVVITHDIDEAVYLADTVFVLRGEPASIVETIDVPLGRERDQGTTKSDPAFVALRTRVHDLITGRASPAAAHVQGGHST
jgi:NitT/TauT family transport system ATP-binding protein